MPYPAAGVGGSVQVGSNTVANVDVWDLPQKALTKDTTAFGASGSYMVNTTTLKQWSAKVKGRADPSDTNGQATLFNGLGSAFTLTFKADGTHNWSGSGLLTNIHPVADVNNVITIEFDFTGTGPLTYT